MNEEITTYTYLPIASDEVNVSLNLGCLYEDAIGYVTDIFKLQFGPQNYETQLIQRFTEHSPNVRAEDYLDVAHILTDNPKYAFNKDRYLDSYCSEIAKALLYAKEYLASKKYDQYLDALLTIQRIRGCFLGLKLTPNDPYQHKIMRQAMGRDGGIQRSKKYVELKTQVQQIAKEKMPKDLWASVAATAKYIYKCLENEEFFTTVLPKASHECSKIKRLSFWLSEMPEKDVMFRTLAKKEKRANL